MFEASGEMNPFISKFDSVMAGNASFSASEQRGFDLFTGPAEQTAGQGKFRTPTLRNVELTAPYMHNGVYATFNEVITHYDVTASDSLLFVPEIENDIANELNYHTDTGLGLSMQDYSDLENFMLTLTDGYF